MIFHQVGRVRSRCPFAGSLDEPANAATAEEQRRLSNSVEDWQTLSWERLSQKRCASWRLLRMLHPLRECDNAEAALVGAM
jgi:hypothetical protein